MTPKEYDHNERQIVLTVITISNFFIPSFAYPGEKKTFASSLTSSHDLELNFKA